MQAAAEIWLYSREQDSLRRVIHTGQGPYLLQQSWLGQMKDQDWATWFCEGNMLAPRGYTPICLAQMIGAPFAWLPLCKGQKRLGLMVLTFPRPHNFSLEEKRVLGM